MLLSESLVAPLMTAWSGYHLLLVDDALDDVLGLVAGRDMPPPPPATPPPAPEPVVPPGLAAGLTGSSTNLSLSNFTRMSCLPMPRKQTTQITTASTLVD